MNHSELHSTGRPRGGHFLPGGYVTIDSQILDLVHRLTEDQREEFEERAAVREFDGGIPRELAECLALLDVYRRHPLAGLGLSAHKLNPVGYVLAADSSRVTALGHRVVGGADLAAVLAEFGGLVLLTPMK